MPSVYSSYLELPEQFWTTRQLSEQDRWIAIARSILQSSLQVRTPLLLMDMDIVRRNLRALTHAMPQVKVFYAIKANSGDDLLRNLRGTCGFDAASAGELHRLRHVRGEDIIFTHPTKDRDALAMIKRARPGAIVVDCLAGLLDLVRTGIPGPDYRPVLLVRIPAIGSNLNKFGLPMFIPDPSDPDNPDATRVDGSAVCQLLREAAKYGFQKLGLAFHVGTQCMDAKRYQRMLVACRQAVIGPLAKEGIAIQVLDIGGGLPDYRLAKQQGISVEKLLAEIGSLLKDPMLVPPGTDVYIEPGRFLVADAGALVTEFLSRRDFTACTLPIDVQKELGIHGDPAKSQSPVLQLDIDDSIFNNLLPQIHDNRPWDIIPFRLKEDSPLSSELVPCVIFGHTCDGFDQLKNPKGYLLPKNIDPGTFGLLDCAGAYTRETATNFNGFPKADVVTFVDNYREMILRVERAPRPEREVTPPCNEILRPSLKAAQRYWSPGGRGRVQFSIRGHLMPAG
ncbi:MAG: hypothetical protein ACKVP0_18585 [Pirellulaceae bacterium]